ncbi:MAG TPA: hypothetical protein VFV75_04390 [Candidatus Polarisedimenticolaceae bacterium]|nr:hypothetical protein [Candidatus Polarisedimenticolaceae bacterium]
MLRLPLIRRTIAACVLVLMGLVFGAGTLHLHPHRGPAAPTPGWSSTEESPGQSPESCLLCRFAQQPVTAEAVLAHAGRPVTLAAPVESAAVEEPRQTAAGSSLPRAPPAASSLS